MPPHSGMALIPQLRSEEPCVLTPVALAARQGPPLVCLAGQPVFFLLKNNTFIMVKLTLSKAYDLITFDLCP